MEIQSDGKAKDSLVVTDNMKCDYIVDNCPPNLEDFKQDVVLECLKRCFRQNVTMKDFNMLKLPLNILPHFPHYNPKIFPPVELDSKLHPPF